MELVINNQGQTRCIYGELIDLASLGSLSITRASHVEPDRHGNWIVDLAPVCGPNLGPFGHRSQALAAEQDWLQENWLISQAKTGLHRES